MASRMLSRLLNYLRGRFRTGKSNADMNPTEVARYGESVNYLPCPECGEGSMEYDAEAGGPKCTVCGAVEDGPE